MHLCRSFVDPLKLGRKPDLPGTSRAEKGEDLEEPAVRTEEYYQSRPCVKACRRAAEILEEYMKEQKRK